MIETSAMLMHKFLSTILLFKASRLCLCESHLYEKSHYHVVNYITMKGTSKQFKNWIISGSHRFSFREDNSGKKSIVAITIEHKLWFNWNFVRPLTRPIAFSYVKCIKESHLFDIYCHSCCTCAVEQKTEYRKIWIIKVVARKLCIIRQKLLSSTDGDSCRNMEVQKVSGYLSGYSRKHQQL